MSRPRITGRPLESHDAVDPILRQVFDKQERLKVSTKTLAKLAGLSPKTVYNLRHPYGDHGKRVYLHQARALALALDFRFPETMDER